MQWMKLAVFGGFGLLMSGCASTFPVAGQAPAPQDGLDAQSIFNQCLAAHGGDLKASASQAELSLKGEWGTLIRKIQPLVTDYGYRIESTEIHNFKSGLSRIEWRGPAGKKEILWDSPEIRVFYNEVESTDPDVLASTAMTSDAFQLFHFGPSYLAWHGGIPVRLTDERIGGRVFHRLLFDLEPGLGLSSRDQVVAYIDAESKRLYRVWLTLEGFRTTRGASVDVTFLEYKDISGHLLPVRLDERVRAPLPLHAHSWEITSIELR